MAVTLAALAACRDGGTGPSRVPMLTVQASGSASQPHVLVEGGVQSVACLFSYRLNAAGDAGASASWQGATLRFYVGADRTTPADSLQLTAAELVEEIGSAAIAPGEHRFVELGFVASIPFGMEAEFRYRVQGADATESVRAYAPCVVPVEQAGSTPARVSDVVITTSPGPLEPGDTLKLSWTAESTTGLWETGVVLTGAFQAQHRTPAAFLKQLATSVALVVPRDVRLGEPVQVQVYAVDLLARGTGGIPVLTAPVSDATVPVLLSATTTGVYGDRLEGQFRSGDDVRVDVTATDNHQLTHLVYEVGPTGAAVRDSVPLTQQGGAFAEVRIPTRPEWSGPGQLRLYVRDRSGNRSREVVSAPGAVRFFTTRSTTVRTAVVPYQPADFAIDTERGQLYVAAAGAAVYFYSLSTLAQAAAVELPASATQVDLWPQGGLLVALLPAQTSLALVDVAERRVRAYVDLTAGTLRTLYGFRVTANGRALVLGRNEDGRAVVVEVNLATRAQRVRTDAPAVPVPDAGVYASLDRSRLLVGAGCLYRADTDAFGPCEQLWPQSEFRGSPFHGSGTGAFWAQDDRVFDAALQLRTRIAPGVIAALSADDRYAWVNDVGYVRRVRVSDGVVEDALAASLYRDTRASADGTMLASVEKFGGTGGYGIRVMLIP